MTVLVTGATGFVGGRLAQRLARDGQQVRVLVRRGSNDANLRGIDVNIAYGDLRDVDTLKHALRGCDTLYHVAADYRLWARRAQDLYDNNVTGTRNIMQAALDCGVARIVYTSSVATLGIRADGVPSDEDTPVTLANMIGHYKRSKFLAEQEVTRLIQQRQLPAVIVNPSTPVGPGDVRPTPTGRVIRDAAAGRIPAFVDTGLNIVHVDDVVQGHLLALERGVIGRRYVLGGQDLSLQDILGIVCRAANRTPPRVRLPRSLIFPVAWLAQCWAALTNGAEPQATIDGLRMSRKKMYFSSARATRELGYTMRAASIALEDATAWFLRGIE